MREGFAQVQFNYKIPASIVRVSCGFRFYAGSINVLRWGYFEPNENLFVIAQK